jgi:hypothetical protein
MPIAVDGLSDPAWTAAEEFNIGIDIFNVDFRALHDDRTLYLWIDDRTDDLHEPGAGAAIWFDDQGGTPPLLADGAWTAAVCNPLPNRGEGSLGWFVTSPSPIVLAERWTEMTGGSACPTVVGQNGSSASIFFHEFASGLATEVALPLTGSSALELSAGELIGLHIESYYVALGQTYLVGIWPATSSQIPSTFAGVSLAALWCNGEAEDFDPLFPVDWVNEAAGGDGWVRSGATGCGAPNGTGASGESACLVRGASTFALQASLVSPWFSLLGQSTATVEYRAVYVDAAAGSNRLDLEVRTASAGWTPLLSWTTTHGAGGGEQVAVDLSSFASEPRVQLRWRYSVDKGDPGFGAQVDQVRLVCAPRIFFDNFESGLTTHWTSEVP